MPVKIEVAEPKDRFAAAAIDFVPPFLLFLVFFAMDKSGLASLTALFGSIYLIFRDLIGNGQSVGKRFLNLQVIDADTDRVPDPMALILRNLGFGVPGLNVVYAVAEGVQALRHPQHLRWGDIFAQTGVVKVPAEDRAKLLVRTVDRPSGSGKAVTGSGPAVSAPNPALDPTAATTPGMTPAPVPAAPLKAGSSAPKPAAPRPTGSGAAAAPRVTGSGPAVKPGVAPAAAPRAATSAPKRAPVSMDLPPEEKKAAAPAPKPAAPKPAAKGVDIDENDPLKALIDQATKQR